MTRERGLHRNFGRFKIPDFTDHDDVRILTQKRSQRRREVQADIVVDCTPKRIAAKNIDVYRRHGLKFILQGGEKHSATGHSFVAESNYATALDREATRVVSCNTTSIVRTLTALKRAGLLQRASPKNSRMGRFR